MSSDKGLVERLRDLQDAHKRENPLIAAMVADVKVIRTEIRGLNKIGNLALGNSHESSKLIEVIEATLVSHVVEMTHLKCAISDMEAELKEQRALNESNSSRLDKASAWLKTKGMQ